MVSDRFLVFELLAKTPKGFHALGLYKYEDDAEKEQNRMQKFTSCEYVIKPRLVEA
jgi:hypothetical protein